MQHPPDRYHRQTLLPQVGRDGQARLARARVLLVGCGALGTVVADYLVRAGVGRLTVADRDVVEWTNLHRQTLFTEDDARAGVPKAVAAAERLRRVNGDVAVEPVVTDVYAGNLGELAGPSGERPRADVIVDGTDNVETRHLLNEFSVKHEVPWVYGACVGAEARQATFDPPRTPCLACLYESGPAPGELPTCDTVGVLGPAAGFAGALQASAAIRLLIGGGPTRHLVTANVWTARLRSIELGEPRAGCPVCGGRRFRHLDTPAARAAVSLCGRNSVQVRPAGTGPVDLSALAARWQAIGPVTRTPYLLRVDLTDPDALQLTVFPDGRLIVAGTADVNRARSLYARYVGS